MAPSTFTSYHKTTLSTVGMTRTSKFLFGRTRQCRASSMSVQPGGSTLQMQTLRRSTRRPSSYSHARYTPASSHPCFIIYIHATDCILLPLQTGEGFASHSTQNRSFRRRFPSQSLGLVSSSCGLSTGRCRPDELAPCQSIGQWNRAAHQDHKSWRCPR